MLFDGHNGATIEVTDQVVIIRRKGLASLMNHGLKGEKRIPFASITSVQFKEPGFMTGYIQFGVEGGKESGTGVGGAVKDENTVLFVKKALPDFRKLRDLVEERSVSARRRGGEASAPSTRSVADELIKLAALRDQGILTEQEFVDEKRKLLAS